MTSLFSRHVLVGAAAAAAIVTLSAAAAVGQSNQPVYPIYDGYIKNADGSYTLAFGYFNQNRDTVTIALGPNNSFNKAPADRFQTTRFLPGHHRFQCYMVVGPEFDGNLRWTLSFADTTTATTEKPIHYNWELLPTQGESQARAIDFKAVTRGVCLNQRPIVRILGQTAGSRGLTIAQNEPAQLFGSVADEGLPRDGQLTIAWRQRSGPGTTRFAAPGSARTVATFSAPGIYELELSATDSTLSGTARLTVTVEPAPR